MKYLILSLNIIFSVTLISQVNPYTYYSIGNSQGANSTVEALFTDSKGNLYAGGNFDSIGGIQAYDIAKWDGTKWSDLGFPSSIGRVFAIEKIGDTLFVAGAFDDGYMVDIAQYYNGSWKPLGHGIISRSGDWVESLEVIDGRLYVGGSFDEVEQANGDELEVNNIAAWYGGSWHQIGIKGLEAHVSSLEEKDGKLLVGGEFYEDYTGTYSFNYIVEFDPSSHSWIPLKDNVTGVDGVDNYVESIFVTDTAIFIGGSFEEAGGKPAYNLARYSNGSWYPYHGKVIDDPVEAMINYKDDFYIGGNFSFDNALGNSIYSLAVLNDTTWQNVGNGLLGGFVVYDMALLDSALYIGGLFDGGGSVPSKNIVKVVKRDTASSSGVSECDCLTGVRVSPNPASDILNIEIEVDKPSPVQLSMFNIMGQLVHLYPQKFLSVGNNDIKLFIPQLSTGTYFIQIKMSDESRVMPLVLSGH